MKSCIIISGGDRDLIPSGGDFHIACDKGYSYAKESGISCDLVLGDFDSLEGGIPETENEVAVYPKEKDDTDTMLAVKYAVEHGFEEVLICCAFGGRIDHLMGNIQAACYAAKRGLRASLTAKDCDIFCLGEAQKKMSFRRRAGFSLSVLAASDAVEGVSIIGTKYEAESVRLTNDFPLGISNEWKDDTAEISLEKGLLLVIESRI